MFTLDVIMIILFVAVIGVIIGLNINSIIDNRLSTIEVKMPPITIPNIIVKVNGINGESTAQFENKDTHERSEFVEMENKHEGFETVKVETVKIENKNENKGHAVLTNPDGQDVVEYGSYTCFKKNNPAGGKIEPDKVAIKKDLVPFNIEQNNDHEYNPEAYYKKYNQLVAHLEDPYLKGFNIDNYAYSSGIDDIGRIKLDNGGAYPAPVNAILL